VLAWQHFTVYPAIDVLEGRVVRLREGQRDQVTVEGGDPVEAAEGFAAAGASWLHLVDLDGAFSGHPDLALLERVSGLGVPVQVGGGYRSVELVEAALGAGAARVLVGTAALDGAFLASAVDSCGDRLAVAIDAREGRLAVDGWTRGTDANPAAFARDCAAAGVSRLVVTATQRDGTLTGPDVQLLEDVVAVGLPTIAAGGIASLDDLHALRNLGCEGAVVGSALWLERIAIADALSVET
jgi:phosphoribosylformimino-5-aminoimidazole carboxamide ribotide isomerase